ncbi:hypothetical protein PRIPAC_70580 [Pristionchus pacificus]|uniref:Uncharacterized protein n=1 Tax=Pristionchus pacificus TaxID=54126 RepID=A0A2A6CAG6_PRIPA|nr:hypothetical protein PRIPAC_70580 [Pristionchus pacificus]|eukprot:PDM75021.1 hypothetical protein PRIPAC_40402 [Pristionchus pacificus]
MRPSLPLSGIDREVASRVYRTPAPSAREDGREQKKGR